MPDHEAVLAAACANGVALYTTGKRMTQLRNFFKTHHKLDPKLQCRLRDLFDDIDLSRVRYTEEAAIPRGFWLSTESGGAITFGYNIFFTKKCDFAGDAGDFQLLVHELTHVRQFHSHGDSDARFACEYYRGYAKADFNETANAMEVQAKNEEEHAAGAKPCVYNGEFIRAVPHNGHLPLIDGSNTFRPTWTHVVATQYVGTPDTDLMFYDRTAGYGEFLRFQPGQRWPLARLHKNTTFRKTWDLIAPIQIGSSPGLFFYDRLAGVGEFYQITPGSSSFLKLRHEGNSFRKTWDLVVPIRIGSAQGLFFYDRNAGEGEYYEITAGSSYFMKLRHKATTFRKTWDKIVPIRIGSSHGLFFYDAANQEGEFHEITGGTTYFTRMRHHGTGFRPSWHSIIPVNEGRSLLFYDRVGHGELLEIDPGSASFTHLTHQSEGWRKTWDLLAAGKYGSPLAPFVFAYTRT